MDDRKIVTAEEQPDAAPAPKRQRRGGKRLVGRRKKVERQARQGRRRRLGRKELLILLLPALAAVVSMLVVALVLNHSASYTLEGPADQFYAGGIFPFPEGGVLKRSRDGSVTMKSGGTTRDVPNLPIYYRQAQSFLLPYDTIYYAPRHRIMGRLSFFSTINRRENGEIWLTRDGESSPLKQGFLYDGEDFYLFLEPVSLTFNGYQFDLPALSWAEVIYGGDVMVYDYERGECFIEPPRTDVTAVAGQGDYTIDLMTDGLTLYDGTSQLIFTRPDLLDEIGAPAS